MLPNKQLITAFNAYVKPVAQYDILIYGTTNRCIMQTDRKSKWIKNQFSNKKLQVFIIRERTKIVLRRNVIYPKILSCS